MRTRILNAARDLYTARHAAERPLTLDEIAATAGITTRQLRTYYTSVAAIERDLTPPASASGAGGPT
jgi:AcrR family transcriptional regulator